MEVRFVSIAAFRTTLDSLLKVKKGVYVYEETETEGRVLCSDLQACSPVMVKKEK